MVEGSGGGESSREGELDVDLVGPRARDGDKAGRESRGTDESGGVDRWRYVGVHQDERRGG